MVAVRSRAKATLRNRDGGLEMARATRKNRDGG